MLESPGAPLLKKLDMPIPEVFERLYRHDPLKC